MYAIKRTHIASGKKDYLYDADKYSWCDEKGRAYVFTDRDDALPDLKLCHTRHTEHTVQHWIVYDTGEQAKFPDGRLMFTQTGKPMMIKGLKMMREKYFSYPENRNYSFEMVLLE